MLVECIIVVIAAAMQRRKQTLVQAQTQPELKMANLFVKCWAKQDYVFVNVPSHSGHIKLRLAMF
jgi:hypothetical protein